MSVRDILHHLEQVYGTQLSHETVSRITGAVLEEARAWQARALDPAGRWCFCPAGPPPLHLPSRLMRWALQTRRSLSAATMIPMRRVRKTESFQKATF